MSINYEHGDNLALFVADNIELINQSTKLFTEKENPDVPFKKKVILDYLKTKLKNDTATEEQRQVLLDCFSNAEYRQNRIPAIANERVLFHEDLKKFYQASIFSELAADIDNTLLKSAINAMLIQAGYSEKKSKYAMSQLRPVAEKAMYLALRNGFTFNRNQMEDGVMAANAGDSAQFLFLARAILAGYNCSNVDVRSSRYDAVIDKNGHLFRVQVKGISGRTLYFKDRDRGGEGIDYTNDRNRGKRITSSDCDIYVAVDKQFGICYIIPVAKIDEWNADHKLLNDVLEYKENWQVIDDLAT